MKVQGCDKVTTERAGRPLLLTLMGSPRASSIRSYKVPFETKRTPRVRRIIERRTMVSSFRRRTQTTELLLAARPRLSVEMSVG